MMRSWKLAALTTCSLLAGGVVSAQQPQRAERVDVARVLIDARVVDEDGRPVLGLEPADFEVTIGGEQVHVESVEWIGAAAAGADPLASTSLAGVLEPAAQGRVIVVVVQKSLEAVRAVGLLRLLQDSGRLLAGLTPDDRVAVLSFDSHLKIWLDFTGDLDRVRTVLTQDVMFHEPGPIEPAPGLSLLSRLTRERGRHTYTIQEALRLLGNALEPLPGSKSVVLVGYGFGDLTYTLGMVGTTLDRAYEEAVAALYEARATVFALDITDADYHTFEVGLQAVAAETGGFFVRTRLHARQALDQVADALTGHYVLSTEKPDLAPGTHRIELRLVRVKGTVFGRRIYVE